MKGKLLLILTLSFSIGTWATVKQADTEGNSKALADVSVLAEKAIVDNFIFEIKSIATVTDFEPTNEQEIAVDEVQKAICTVSKKEIKGNDLLTFRRARDGVPARSSWHIN